MGERELLRTRLTPKPNFALSFPTEISPEVPVAVELFNNKF
jgi:hypothetical protein